MGKEEKDGAKDHVCLVCRRLTRRDAPFVATCVTSHSRILPGPPSCSWSSDDDSDDPSFPPQGTGEERRFSKKRRAEERIEETEAVDKRKRPRARVRSLQKSIKNNSHTRKCLKPRKPTKVRSQEHAGNNGPPVRQIKASDVPTTIDRSSDHWKGRLLSWLLSLSLSLGLSFGKGSSKVSPRPDMPKPSSSSSAWVPLLSSPFLALPRERNVSISGGGTSGQHISEQVSSFSCFVVSVLFFSILVGSLP